MSGENTRSILLIVAAVVVGLAALGFLSTILNAIVPLTVVALVAFFLGRASRDRDLVGMATGALRRAGSVAARSAAENAVRSVTKPKEAAEPKPAQAAEKPVAPARATESRLADTASETPAEAEAVPLTDFQIKSTEEIEAEAARLRDEVARRSADYDPMAAIEERKRRLLGGDGEAKRD